MVSPPVAPEEPLPLDGPARVHLPLWAVLAVVAVVGVAVQVVRPLAPPLGPIPDAARWFDAAHLERVDAYWGPMYRAGLLSLALRVGVPLLIALTPPGRRLVRRVIDRVGARRPARAAAVVAVAIVVGTDVVLAPLAFWAGYVHEGAFGFRVQGFGGWARDWLVLRAPGWVGAGLLTLTGYALARRLPGSWPLLAAAGAAVLTAVVVFAQPVVIEPLRHRTVPLAQGVLHDEVTALVDRSGLRVDRILVADASRRTIRHNAYVSGLGRTRRVVLYDTLVEDRPVDEVVMVLAHELGHERHRDLARGTATGAAGAAAAALAIAILVRRRMTSGRQRSATDPTAIAAIVALVVVLNAVSLPVQGWLSRRAEAAADLAALDLTADPETFVAMNRELSVRNLSDPQPPPWARLLWSSHPSTVERLAMGERWPFDDPTPRTDQEER
jgi:STE24 endopeptidase